jgi:hypothetical protein
MRQRLAWALFGLTVVGAVGQVVTLADGGQLTSHIAIVNGWPIITLACLAGAFFGAVIVARYPRHRIGWLLLVGQSGTQVGMVAQFYALHVLSGHGWGAAVAGHWAEWFSAFFSANWALALVAVLFLLAPGGSLPSPRWRVAIAACVLGLVTTFAGILLTDPAGYTPDGHKVPHGLPNLLLNVAIFSIVGGMVAGAVALVRRLRQSSGEERQQLRWIAASATFLAGTVVLLIVVAIVVNDDDADPLALDLLLYVAYASLPVATGVAVLRHRLYDIDLIVNRAVLVTLATAFAAAGYVVLVVLVGGNAGGFWPSLLATAVVAMAFQPLRLWVVRLADRFAYGARAAPYEALSDLGRRLGEAPDPTRLLPAVARAAGEAVSATSAVARLTVGGLDRSARWPADADPAHGSAPTTRVPVGPEPLGSLAVALPRGRELRDHERLLLHRLAEQASLAFRNAGLSAELACRVDDADRAAGELAGSRRRLIAARDDERARLELAIRRDVLAHLTPLPDRLAELAEDSPVRSGPLGELIDACGAGLEALREITRGVYPAQLARSGLGIALSAHLTRWGRGSLEVDARVEAAAYFCFAEGVRDFAPPVDVTLGVSDDHLVLTLRGSASSDGGLQRMRDRLDALGGSVTRDSVAGNGPDAGPTVLTVRVPVAPVPADRAMAAVGG